MSVYRRCRHGLFMAGGCFNCEFEPEPSRLARIAGWLDTTPPTWYDPKGAPLVVDVKVGPSWGECGDL